MENSIHLVLEEKTETFNSVQGTVKDEGRADIAPTFLRLLMAEAGSNGPSPSALLRGSGLQPEDFKHISLKVSFRQCAEVLRRFWAARPTLSTGLAIGCRLNTLALGDVGVGLMTSENIQDMLEFLIEFQQQAGFPLPLSLCCSAARQEVWVEVTPRFAHLDIEPFLVVYTLAAVNQLIRQATGTDFRASRVELAVPRPADALEYEKTFGCSISFAAKSSMLCLPLAPPLKLPAAEPDVVNRMRELLRHAVPSSPRFDYSTAVVQILRRSNESPPTLAQIAATLNLSERTLRRKLHDDGLTYRGLIGESRRQRTMALLMQSSAPMMEVALQTGYSSPRSLRRAVQRWTGVGPSSVRRTSWNEEKEDETKSTLRRSNSAPPANE